MKRLATALAFLVVCAFAATAFAQPAPNPKAEHEWQHFLNKHQGLAEHPQWLNNPQYMKQHPNMAKWLHEHPRVLADSRSQGMWDQQGQWHNSDWWRDNHPNQMYQNHPEWAENHPNWRGPNDGAYDEHHQWKNRGWWEKNQHNWVEKNHPNWLNQHNHAGDHGHDNNHDHGNHDHG